MRWRVAIAGVAALLLLVTALAITWGARHASEGPVTVTGTVEALQVDVSTKIAGRIAELAVREGQPVERGQRLVRLDATELMAEARRADAAVRQAEAALRDLRAGARREEIQEAEAQAARAQAQLNDLLAGARAQEIEQAQAALRNATATRVLTERELRRVQELFARELVAMAEVDRARQAHDVAVANETSARERLDLVQAGPRPHEVEAARATVRAARERVQLLRAGPRRDAVSAAEAQLAEARAALALAQRRVEEMILISPIPGIVLHKHMEAGETANPGVPILTLMDPTDVWLRAYVPETEVGRVKVGQAAVITADGLPSRSFAGAVTEVASAAEFTPKNVQTRTERVNLVFRIRIAVQNPDGALKPGLPADAELRP